MSFPPKTLSSAVADFTDYVEPNYEVGAGYASPAEIRAEVNEYLNALLAKHFGGDNGNKSIANAYAFNAHLGQAMRYFDAAKDEFVKAVLAAHCKKGERKREREAPQQ